MAAVLKCYKKEGNCVASKGENANVVCPFFKRQSSKGRIGIICEGFEGVGEVGIYFANKRKREKYQESFCYCECHVGCPVAQLASEKWEDGL